LAFFYEDSKKCQKSTVEKVRKKEEKREKTSKAWEKLKDETGKTSQNG